MTQESFSLKAPAKINLGLKVGEQRPDGFHELSTMFQTISLCDRISITFSPELTEDELTVTGPVSMEPRDGNLVLETLGRLRREWTDLSYAKVDLEKHIPIGAGLGGGSSDAAAVIHAVRQFWLRDVSEERLRRIASEIGADVPFFLIGGTARGEGIGEDLSSIEDFNGYVVLAVPPIEVDTEWAYKKLESDTGDGQYRNINHLLDNQFHNNINSSNMLKMSRQWQSLDLVNDFEEIVTEEFAIYDDLLARLEEDSSHVSLSGSGSAIYSLFNDENKARELKERLNAEFTDVQFFCEQFVSSDQIPMFTQGV